MLIALRQVLRANLYDDAMLKYVHICARVCQSNARVFVMCVYVCYKLRAESISCTLEHGSFSDNIKSSPKQKGR